MKYHSTNLWWMSKQWDYIGTLGPTNSALNISTIYQGAQIFHVSVLCALAGLMQYTHIVGDITYLVGQEAIFKR